MSKECGRNFDEYIVRSAADKDNIIASHIREAFQQGLCDECKVFKVYDRYRRGGRKVESIRGWQGAFGNENTAFQRVKIYVQVTIHKPSGIQSMGRSQSCMTAQVNFSCRSKPVSEYHRVTWNSISMLPQKLQTNEYCIHCMLKGGG